jgi:hypothetical protein
MDGLHQDFHLLTGTFSQAQTHNCRRVVEDLEACIVLTSLSRHLQERRKERKRESKYTHSELEQVLTPTPYWQSGQCFPSINDDTDVAAASR